MEQYKMELDVQGKAQEGSKTDVADPDQIERQDTDPHKSDKLNPDPHQSGKLDPDQDPHQFADDDQKFMKYEPI